ncbi:hypothetical protein B0T26DRAFT_155970 [Lasiosphaeria miniovina]|uniref:Uncharacterized protein n=1 Tax=Lasiosphaeria miniovina TaxID=1954250 RepID=A0AA40B5K9_9PEZI|nr:uncharacterized protein B0T26DRAFT_155970 [Lasiosphaeria miniovina]KAK0728049.1 hypothetical protein B0T26DRAFT_155970 [Lasiosphaeria miniovina]
MQRVTQWYRKRTSRSAQRRSQVDIRGRGAGEEHLERVGLLAETGALSHPLIFLSLYFFSLMLRPIRSGNSSVTVGVSSALAGGWAGTARASWAGPNSREKPTGQARRN